MIILSRTVRQGEVHVKILHSKLTSTASCQAFHVQKSRFEFQVSREFWLSYQYITNILDFLSINLCFWNISLSTVFLLLWPADFWIFWKFSLTKKIGLGWKTVVKTIWKGVQKYFQFRVKNHQNKHRPTLMNKP